MNIDVLIASENFKAFMQRVQDMRDTELSMASAQDDPVQAFKYLQRANMAEEILKLPLTIKEEQELERDDEYNTV